MQRCLWAYLVILLVACGSTPPATQQVAQAVPTATPSPAPTATRIPTPTPRPPTPIPTPRGTPIINTAALRTIPGGTMHLDEEAGWGVQVTGDFRSRGEARIYARFFNPRRSGNIVDVRKLYLAGPSGERDARRMDCGQSCYIEPGETVGVAVDFAFLPGDGAVYAHYFIFSELPGVKFEIPLHPVRPCCTPTARVP